ncbi:ATP-binding cassette domain-containing protein [Coralloluteibacterium stylophorae]|uniref:ATP-binding cassette domain-containing protein n=1 Tax=Coralloluteibacterium stylophorae TaxID=1776034 RepID=A0A8J7VSB3_9GAMM|nr:ATP-binding cassette domain-containing protein [Coralloluteibacterium stylophorae]MBS7458837.1 ATP-binding cassette domain-containing protein [Coralloluteibacterium stylophorae]
MEVRDLRFAYPGSAWTLAVPALRIARGERIFLHGPSGSGKSTLLNLVAGTLRPDAGTVRVAGREVSALGGWRRDRARADSTGILFQQFNLMPFLSPVDNVLLPCRFSVERRRRARARFGSLAAAASELLRRLRLPEATWTRRAGSLSVGQQQRVAAARALIGEPALVIADEPTSALDVRARDDFLELLFAECDVAGSGLLLVSHDLAIARRFHLVESLADLQAERAA